MNIFVQQPLYCQTYDKNVHWTFFSLKTEIGGILKRGSAMLLDWYENLYVSEQASKKLKRTISRINRKKITPEIYVLTFPSNDKNVMDIVSTNILLQTAVRRRCPKIIGLAKGKEDALELMQTILMETYEHTGDFCVKEYLEDRR